MDRCDGILMELLQERKTIINFLDAVFGFLARRTDFYHVMKTEEGTIGFPSGAKENLVLCVLKKYDTTYQKKPSSCRIEMNAVPPTMQERSLINNHIIEINSVERSKETFQENEYYNGRCFENYCWNQTITDLEFYMLLPERIAAPKELNVRIDSDYLKVTQKERPDIALLEGKLSKKCKNADAVWSISEGKLQISIDKTQELWWDRFFEFESPLDLSKIDCSRPMEELPQESQGALKRLRFDQEQKLLGLPTSEEIKNKEILRAAWDAEGSPFKGQPFDPSLLRFN